MSEHSQLHRVPWFRRPIFLIFVSLILAVGVAVAVVLLVPSSSIQPQSGMSPGGNPVDTSHSSLHDAGTSEGDTPAEPEGITQFEGADPNTTGTLSGAIASQYIDTASNTAIITVSIDQYLSSGTCTLQLIQSGATAYQATQDINADVATSFCGPFKIPLAGLSGTYEISLAIISNDKTGHVTGEITI